MHKAFPSFLLVTTALFLSTPARAQSDGTTPPPVPDTPDSVVEPDAPSAVDAGDFGGTAPAGIGGDPAAPGDAPVVTPELPPTVTTGPLSAWGDSFEQANIVRSRPRPGLDAQGISLGSFTLLPTLAMAAGYDDNIFATENHRVSSAILTLEPNVLLSRTSDTNSLSLAADGLIARYADASRANYEQFNVKGDGVLALSSAVAVDGNAHYSRQAEPRGTAGDISVDGSPIIYHNPGAALEVMAGNGPFQARLGGSFDRFTYDSFESDGASVSQSYRNRNSYAGNGQLGFEIGPGMLAFVSGAYDREDYDQHDGPTLTNSSGYSVLGGLDFHITKLIRGRVGAGYLWRHYSNGSFAPLSGFNYDASVVWNVTELLSWTLKAAKKIEESPSVGISGIIANTFSTSIDWEIIRKIIVSASVDYVREKYRGLARVDRRLEPTVDIQYQANRFFSLDLNYDYRDQYGYGPLVRRYKENIVKIGLTFRK